jgi:hypothetical protein
MKTLKIGSLLLVASLFASSCGNSTEETSTTTDTIAVQAPAPDTAAPRPDTVNAMDSTVKINESRPGVWPVDAKVGG